MSTLSAFIDKLKPRERRVAALFAAVFLGAGYFSLVFRPVTSAIEDYRRSIGKSRERLEDLRRQYPEPVETGEKISEIESGLEKLKREVLAMEQSLPDQPALNDFLNELISQAKSYPLVSAKQKVDIKHGAPRFYLEVRFLGTFEDMVNYIARIETISPFLAVESVNISEGRGKEDAREMIVSVTVSTLIGDRPGFQAKSSGPEKKITLARDIFRYRPRPGAEAQIALKVQGITFFGGRSTAVINGSVVRIGEEINSFKVKDITPQEVTVFDGEREFILRPEVRK
jgi:Tfp pilus assembly protein PilO